jgi:hypothetical protein
MIKGGVSILAFLIAALALCSSCRTPKKSDPPPTLVFDPEPRNSWSAQEGIEHLETTRTFAFGGVGFAGTTSDGEYAFRAVFKSFAAPQLFSGAYSQATLEGQLYILCGLHITNRGIFDDYAAPLLKDRRTVSTMSGCVIRQEPIADVVKRIADGAYDAYVPKLLPPTQPAPERK